MTEDQLMALKVYIDIKVAHAMAPVFGNEMDLMKAEELLDRVMLGPPVPLSSQPKEEPLTMSMFLSRDDLEKARAERDSALPSQEGKSP